jgi:hypothetical protein
MLTKLEEINKKLIAIREKKNKLSRCKSTVKKDPPVALFRSMSFVDEPKEFKTPKFKKPSLKLYHPDKARVYGEVIYSPYLTRPNAQYPPVMYEVQAKLSNMRKKGLHFSDLPPEEVPYDLEATKKKFISDVIEFNPCFLRRKDDTQDNPDLNLMDR